MVGLPYVRTYLLLNVIFNVYLTWHKDETDSLTSTRNSENFNKYKREMPYK